MLNRKNNSKYPYHRLFALHLFISIITFHSVVSAETTQEFAEKYRDEGYAAQQRGKFNDALKYYSKAISLGLESPVVLNDIGILYEQFGLQQRAEGYYLDAIRLDENYLPSYMNIAYLYQSMGENDRAFNYFLKRYNLGDPDDPWTQKAKKELLAVRPDYEKWFIAQEVDRLNKELTQKKREEFIEEVKLSKEHFKRGKKYFKRKQYEKSIAEYNQALRITPKDDKILMARKQAIFELTKENIRKRSDEALLLLESGDPISARNEYRKILTTLPNKQIYQSQ